VICTQPHDVSGISPCTREETDTRIFIHVADAVKRYHRRVMIRTVDSDILVLSIAAAQYLEIDQLWVGFATGKPSDTYLHMILLVLSAQKSVKPCHSYTLSADVTLYLHLLVEEKRQCGIFGWHFLS
jgi:hypothetical protein